MSARLREADARAVDLLLDRAVSSAQDSGNGDGLMYAASHPGVSNEQIAAVEKVLSLLDAMPAGEPPQDLVRRTLDWISSHTDAPMRGPSPILIDSTSRPHA
jgi:hypothetical protein